MASTLARSPPDSNYVCFRRCGGSSGRQHRGCATSSVFATDCSLRFFFQLAGCPTDADSMARVRAAVSNFGASECSSVFANFFDDIPRSSRPEPAISLRPI